MLKACPDIVDFSLDGIRHWHQLAGAAERLHPMMGITADACSAACRIMGVTSASITLAAILQKGEAIARPGGHLRALSAKAAEGGFSPGQMIMALLRAPGSPHG